MKKLEGKTAYITGGGRGIGRAVALKLAADGAHVVINPSTRLTEAAAENKTIVVEGQEIGVGIPVRSRPASKR